MPDTWDFSQSRPRRADPLAQMPVLTYLLVALCVLITGASMLGGNTPGSLLYALGNFGYATPEQIWNGRVWGLVTSVFIHVGLLHLLFNMQWMLLFGRILERTLPPLTYLAFLVAAAAVSSACQTLVSGATGVGMSGVIYAMFGLMWAGRGAFAEWRSVATQSTLRLFIIWGLLCVVATYVPFLANLGLRVGNGAHGGGFLFGLCVGYLFYSPRRRYVWAAPLALLLAASVLACTWQPWSGDWTFWKGNREFDRKHYAQAIQWYQASLRHGADPHDAWTNISLAWNKIAADDAARKDSAGAANAISEYQSAAQKAGPGE